MSHISIAVNVAAILVLVLAASFQLYAKPVLSGWGVWRVAQSVGNSDCIRVPELKACEKMVIHQPTGLLYLACSTPQSRTHWTPTLDRLNATGRSENDYVAIYDPISSSITRLRISGYNSDRGLSVHGMDIVPSVSNPTDLFVYLVNHRIPLHGKNAKEVGADSSIEVFTTTVGTSTLTHVRTVEDPVILTPNDIVGSSDGKSFHFTNDHGSKTGFKRILEKLGLADSSVGYCHVDKGCKIAIDKMIGNNGIARARDNDTFYVASASRSRVSVLELQRDDTLVLTNTIPTDRGIDNLMVDDHGHLWGAGIVNIVTMVFSHMDNPTEVTSPSSALRISLNTGVSSFYGEKYKVMVMFEDDGTFASGSTTAAYDSQRGRLFMHGVSSPQLTVCRI